LLINSKIPPNNPKIKALFTGVSNPKFINIFSIIFIIILLLNLEKLILLFLLSHQQLDDNRKKKGRQGRSHAVRNKLEEIRKREKEERLNLKLIYEKQILCSYCKKETEIIDDESTAESICTECGTIVEGSRLFHQELTSSIKDNEKNFNIHENCSKPYKRVSHFQQRIAQLSGKGPAVEDYIVKKIDDYCIKNNIDLENVFKKEMSFILKKLELPRKISSHYIQIRKRLNVFNVTELPQELKQRLKERFLIVEYVISKYSNIILEERRNILNLNYLIFQLLQLESKEYSIIYAPFLPQLIAKNQPFKINRKWRMVIEIIKSFTNNHHRVYFLDKLNIDLNLYDWNYEPLSPKFWFFCNRYKHFVKL